MNLIKLLEGPGAGITIEVKRVHSDKSIEGLSVVDAYNGLRDVTSKIVDVEFYVGGDVIEAGTEVRLLDPQAILFGGYSRPSNIEGASVDLKAQFLVDDEWLDGDVSLTFNDFGQEFYENCINEVPCFDTDDDPEFDSERYWEDMRGVYGAEN